MPGPGFFSVKKDLCLIMHRIGNTGHFPHGCSSSSRLDCYPKTLIERLDNIVAMEKIKIHKSLGSPGPYHV